MKQAHDGGIKFHDQMATPLTAVKLAWSVELWQYRKTLESRCTMFVRISRKLRWSRLSEQIFRIDKWSVCRG
jgi:hypothetical protein